MAEEIKNTCPLPDNLSSVLGTDIENQLTWIVLWLPHKHCGTHMHPHLSPQTRVIMEEMMMMMTTTIVIIIVTIIIKLGIVVCPCNPNTDKADK